MSRLVSTHPYLELPALLGPAGRHRDLALALIIPRVAHPGSKLSTIAWWQDVTLGADLGTADPAAFTEIAGVAHDTLGLKRMVMAGDRGMITSARIEARQVRVDHRAALPADPHAHGRRRAAGLGITVNARGIRYVTL